MQTPKPPAPRPSALAPRLDGPSPRLYFIDWLRVLAVLLLFPFHTLRVFNADDPFYVKADHLSAAVSYVLNFISVWHMPLLFVLAGASTWFALGKRSPGQYLRERRIRLLVPFVFGVFVLIPPQTWFGGRFNSGYAQSFWHYIVSGDFLKWNVKDGGDYYGGFGIGHLWFIIILFLLAAIALPLFARTRNGRGGELLRSFSRRLAHPAGWLLAAFLIFVGAALPDPIGLKPLYYLVFFVLGYAIVCDPQFMKSAERYRLPALSLGVGLSVWWVVAGEALRDSMPDPSLQIAALTMAGTLASWLVIVGVLGYGRRYLDRPSPSLAYLAEGSYPVYIIHQTVIVIAAFSIVRLAASEPLQWLTLLVVSVVCTFGLYEVVRRFRATRFLFGMRPSRKAGAVSLEPTRSTTPVTTTTSALSAPTPRSAAR
ncbi:MAG TPA: acyltransferase family protein [Thermoleophilia bacterium]|nr:acyltransferase family protein [Thermoleophilia bacterium]